VGSPSSEHVRRTGTTGIGQTGIGQTGLGQSEVTDVVIVGSRCAGAPLSALLSLAGIRVTVLEQARFPKPVLSSHLMEADALDFLRRLGVEDALRATGIRPHQIADIRLNDVRFKQPFPLRFDDLGGSVFLRRHLLDDIVAQRAVEVGADIRMGAKVVDLLWDDNKRVCGVRVREGEKEYDIRAQLVVGADGRNSSVANLVGSRKYNIIPNERSYYFTFFEGADESIMDTFVFHRFGDRMLWSGSGDNGLYLVGVSPESHEREYFRTETEKGLLAHMRACDAIADGLANARIATKIAGIRSFEGYYRQAAGPGWILVGDSGHFKDPALGRGIGDAFQQAQDAAEAIIEGLPHGSERLDANLARWWVARDAFFEGHSWLAANLGRAGAIPAAVTEAVRIRQMSGDLTPFFDLFCHRTRYDDVFSLRKLTMAAMSAVRHSDSPGPVLRESMTQLLREPVRRWRRRPSQLVPAELSPAMPVTVLAEPAEKTSGDNVPLPSSTESTEIIPMNKDTPTPSDVTTELSEVTA